MNIITPRWEGEHGSGDLRGVAEKQLARLQFNLQVGCDVTCFESKGEEVEEIRR
jgi:hypothetical protein